MTEDWREEDKKEVLRVREMLMQFCMGDTVAVQLIEDFIEVAHLWDDLYDRDKDRTPREINETFCKMLGDIPNNPLYQSNVGQIAPLTLLSSLTWMIANRLESGNEDDKLGSFILRNGLLNLIYYIILIVGNSKNKPTWGVDVGELFFRDFFKGYHAKYQEFLAEMEQKENKPIPIKKARRGKK